MKILSYQVCSYPSRFISNAVGLGWRYLLISLILPSVHYPPWSDCGWRSTVKTSMSPLSTRPSGCCVSTCGVASASDAWLTLQRPSSRGSRNKVPRNGRCDHVGLFISCHHKAWPSICYTQLHLWSVIHLFIHSGSRLSGLQFSIFSQYKTINHISVKMCTRCLLLLLWTARR